MNNTPQTKHATWPWVTAFVAVATILGNGIAFIIDRTTQADVRDAATQEAVISSLEKELERLNYQREKDFTRIAELQAQNALLTREMIEKELSAARSGKVPPIEVVREIIQTHPGLFWAKLRVGYKSYVMVAVSQGYADVFLDGNPVRYANQPDTAIWGNELAQTFADNDERAFNNERRPLQIQEEMLSGTFVGFKWHVKLTTGQDIIFGTGQLIPSTSP